MDTPDLTQPPPLPSTPADAFDSAQVATGDRPPSRIARWLIAGLAVALIVTAAVLQHPAEHLSQRAQDIAKGLIVEPPAPGQEVLFGKVLVAFHDNPEYAWLLRAEFDQSGFTADDPSAELRSAMLMIACGYEDEPPPPPPDLAMLSTGLKPKTISARLDAVEKAIKPESPLTADLALARSLLEASEQADQDDGSGGFSGRELAVAHALAALPTEQRDQLVRRHEWFAKVLLSTGVKNDQVRAKAESDAWMLTIGLFVIGALGGCAFLTGCVLLIVALIQKLRGRMRSRFVPPSPTEQPSRAESVWLETVCVFLAGFIGLKLILQLLRHLGVPDDTAIVITLLAHWTLVATIFWPLVRGVTWHDWKQRIGWRADRGVWREIGAGILGYLAGVPVMVAAVVIIFMCMALWAAITGHEPAAPHTANRVEEILGGGGLFETLATLALLSIWAPLVEESIFRGALFRHLRRRLPAFLAAAGSAFVFASVHPYILMQMFLVGSLGLVFALMREWRGSLIPSATAHCIQNSFAFILIMLVGPLMRP